MKPSVYDLLVIGGGSGGVRIARRVASLGKKVALFEKSQTGGTCVLKGCIPKKLMVYGSSLPEVIRLSKEYGWEVPSFKLNWSFQKKRREKELSRLSSIYDRLLKESGVTLIREEASFKNEKEIIAGGNIYQSSKIVIATGGYPYRPSLPGIHFTITSDEVFQLEKQPKSLIIVGAGYIALEFAGIFQSLGTEVTLLFRRDQVLHGFDLDVRSFFQKQALLSGLQMIPHFQPAKIESTKNGLCIWSQKGDKKQAEQILFATGRKPLLSPLNLDKAGVKLSSRHSIQVSSTFETTTKGIYAIGDCADTPFQLTPVALREAEILMQYLFRPPSVNALNPFLVPSAVFSHPNIATVGFTEKQAIEKGFSVQVFESQFRPLKLTINPKNTGEKIYMKLLVDQKTDRVIGCHIVGEDAPEIIQGIAIAMQAKATKKDFDQTIGVHPSSAEELCTMRTPRTT